MFYYRIIKIEQQKKRAIVEAMFLLGYTFWYIAILDKTAFNVESLVQGGLCRFTFYALVMFAGMEYKVFEENCPNNMVNARQGLYCGIFAILMFAASYFIKIGMSHNVSLMRLQFICQVFTLVSGLCLFVFLRSIENKLEGQRISKYISIGADYSWEIYLTQTLIIPLCENVQFPFGIVVALLGIEISSIVLKSATNCLLKNH